MKAALVLEVPDRASASLTAALRAAFARAEELGVRPVVLLSPAALLDRDLVREVKAGAVDPGLCLEESADAEVVATAVELFRQQFGALPPVAAVAAGCSAGARQALAAHGIRHWFGAGGDGGAWLPAGVQLWQRRSADDASELTAECGDGPLALGLGVGEVNGAVARGADDLAGRLAAVAATVRQVGWQWGRLDELLRETVWSPSASMTARTGQGASRNAAPPVDDPAALASWLAARLPTSARVLDLHCGDGQRLAALAALGCTVLHGIDADAAAVERARAAAAGDDRLQFWVDDATAPAAVPRRDYDAVLAIDGAPLEPASWRAGLQRGEGLLGPRGLLVLRTGQDVADLHRAAAASGAQFEGLGDAQGRTTGVLQRRVRPQVLVVVDAEGWAHDHKAAAIAAHLADEFEVIPCQHRDLTAARLDAADLVVVFYWQQLAGAPEVAAALRRCEPKLLLGVCSHAEIEGERRAAAAAALRRARAVFVHSRLLAAEVRALLGAAVPVAYCPNGVDLDRFRPGDAARQDDHQAGHLRVGWAGSLGNFGRDLRGFDDIAQACARTPGVEFAPAIKEQRQRSHAEMAGWHRQNDVYVCFSRSEGTPNPALEAAASGVPVISTAVGNMPELLRDGDNGWLVARQREALASALADLAARGDRARLALESRRAALAWGWELQAERFRLLFRSVLADAPLPAEPVLTIVALADNEADVRAAARSSLQALLDRGAEVVAAKATGAHHERLLAAAASSRTPWLLAVYQKASAGHLRKAWAAAQDANVDLVWPDEPRPSFALLRRSALRAFPLAPSPHAAALQWQAQAAWLEAEGRGVVRLPAATSP